MWLWRVAVPFLVVGLWYLVYRFGGVDRVLLPSPRAVWDAGLQLHDSGVLWPNLWSTLLAALEALALSAVAGVPLGILLGMLPRTWAVLAPYLNAVNSMPRIAFAPVFVVAFGIGQSSKVALGFSIAFFVFLMNARIGVLSTDEEHLRVCVALGASRSQLFRKLYVPVAVPAVFTALRLGLVLALLGVVGSEIIASRVGVGQLITTYSATLSMAPVYALLIVLAACTSILTMLVGATESALLGWQRTDRARPRPGGSRGKPTGRTPPSVTGHDGAAATPVVRLESVSVEFARHRVLSDISLSIPRGQFVAIVGASGSGKSTLLNAVSGLVPVASGRLGVFGEPARAGRADVGHMFARDALLPWRTARRNVELGLEFRGRATPVRREHALRMLDLVRLPAAADRYPSQLSHGMRQRVALARTLASDPELLLMDEPFAALDALTRSSIRDMFLDIWDTRAHRKTVLFVTHDLTEALVLADRVVTLTRDGVRTDVAVPYGRPRDERELMARSDYRDLYERLRNDLKDAD
ncbi:ATP-binding cassette domain-containing protein [Actinoplanes missouriensis]|uniref:ATP-binding cassette domain-containing protein n=1 Tax=Actinoplanes missouriensis TaxID=1866 RepID=UPI0002D2973D|nr:ATP-binding cassette domain-containing protein [Actinoplanes missouriensis]